MARPLFYRHMIPFAILAVLHIFAIAQDDRSNGNLEERDALDALKVSFSDPFLNSNWTGFPCNTSTTDPPKWYGIQCVNGRVTSILLEDMKLSGNINDDVLLRFSELSILSFKNNSIWGNLMNFSNNQQMKHIDLSGNMFYGPISPTLLNLNLLETMLLQDNGLTGQIPEFKQSGLKEFNVSNNNLVGVIPSTPTLQAFGSDSYSGNPGLYGLPPQNSFFYSSIFFTTNNDAEKSNAVKRTSNNLQTLFLVSSVVLLLAVILLSILYSKKARKLKRMTKENVIFKKIEDEDDKIEAGEKGAIVGEERGGLVLLQAEAKFEMGDLLKASAEALGEGIFGMSYKAKLNNGPAIVVKRLKDLKPLTGEEFSKQLHLIADLKHPNLLFLLAYYNTKDEKLLLYKYAEKGNLFFRIHGGRGGDRIPFKWSSRLSVARGVGRALEYLHLNTKSQIIVPHGNLKSTNVVLDENDKILVSDYGLSSLIALPVAAQRMVVYKSPEYQYAKKVSKQSDVWSYGCLLLELLTGKVSAYTAPVGVNGVDICSWVNRAVREEWTAEIIDPEICVHRSASPGMLRLLQIAMMCTERSPEKRPEMTNVVREVENLSIVESDDGDEDDVSLDKSLTDDSVSTSASGIIGD
ncbi:Receptor-like kinase [Quillaja saponaria]|uniref:Receptor-like kinase n=1 Tax=Quillaja saponaria TaxID=32244 RepID=A0AAD7P931_QUISA|nr:Receptor-like kinase [Quillaja saponaria]